jgi:hypothetical protein
MITFAEVAAAARAVAAEKPDWIDVRAVRDLEPRYVEHGKPCCLVAEVLTRLGWSKTNLKQLDHEPGRSGGGIKFAESRNLMLRRIDPLGLQLLDYLQRHQDTARTWGEVVADAFRPEPSSPYWSRADLLGKPWLEPGDQQRQ